MVGSLFFQLSFLLTQQFFGSTFNWDAPERFIPQISRVYIPIGFDNNDVSQIVVEVEFKNTCEEFGRASVFPHEEFPDVLLLHVEARRRDGFCLPVINRQPKVIDVGILPVSPEGGYRIVDFKSLDTHYGNLRVREAKSSKIDDNNYAPIDSLFVREEPNGLRRTVILSGTFSDTCMFFSRIDIGKTEEALIEILPVVDRVDSPDCERKPVPFLQPVDIPLREGRHRVNSGQYLFYVRTMNGGSFAKTDHLILE